MDLSLSAVGLLRHFFNVQEAHFREHPLEGPAEDKETACESWQHRLEEGAQIDVHAAHWDEQEWQHDNNDWDKSDQETQNRFPPGQPFYVSVAVL